MDNILQQHLDHCLLCRSCENICPAQVPFARIMDSTRASMPRSALPGSWYKKRLLNFVSKRKFARSLVTIIKRLRLVELMRLMPSSKSTTLDRYLQFAVEMKPAPQWQEYYPPVAEQKFAVGLFLGCVNEFFDSSSLQDSIRVLNHLGIGVFIPADQQCCGALHLHAGEKRAADRFYLDNVHAFERYDIKAVISLASACTATMIDQANAASSQAQIPSWSMVDMCSFLESIAWSEGMELQPINSEVQLHYPCTQRNVLKNTDAVYSLISRIPGLLIHDFPRSGCCGAAGSYTLDYPEWSARIRDSAVDAIEIQTGLIVSSNIGCILQFRNICNKNDNLEVIHPINLVARALGM